MTIWYILCSFGAFFPALVSRAKQNLGQMAIFQTKNPTVGKFWRDLQWKMLVYILWPLGLFNCHYLVYLYPVLVYCTKKNLATLEKRVSWTLQTLDDLEARTKLAGIDISTRQSFLRDPKAAVANLKRQGSI
jgi:hypothetical protein